MRRSLFSSESERGAFLSRLVNATRGLLRQQRGLAHHANYHEFCRLLGRLKANYQLSELVRCCCYLVFCCCRAASMRTLCMCHPLRLCEFRLQMMPEPPCIPDLLLATLYLTILLLHRWGWRATRSGFSWSPTSPSPRSTRGSGPRAASTTCWASGAHPPPHALPCCLPSWLGVYLLLDAPAVNQ